MQEPRGYKLEMHLHTSRNSDCGKECPKDIARIYADAGYDGIVCTNHLNRNDLYGYVAPPWKRLSRGVMECYLRDFFELKDECAALGIDVFAGAEVSPDQVTYYKPGHPYAEYLLYGVTADELREYGQSFLTMDQEQLFRWCDERGILLVQAHPYREICDVMDVRYLHGIEVANTHPGHDSRNALALELCKRTGLVPTGGSDFHYRGGEGGGTVLPRAPKDERDLAAILRERRHKIILAQGGEAVEI